MTRLKRSEVNLISQNLNIISVWVLVGGMIYMKGYVVVMVIVIWEEIEGKDLQEVCNQIYNGYQDRACRFLFRESRKMMTNQLLYEEM